MLKKFGMGLALTATFGLLACSDSSSSSDGGKVTISCKVEKEKPLTIKSSEGPFSGTITYDLNKDGKVVETYEISSEAVAKDECAEMEKDEDINTTPVLILSALEAAGHMFMGKPMIKGVCFKPFSPAALIDKVKQVMGD